MSFAYPWALGFLAAVPAVLLLWVWGIGRARRSAGAIARGTRIRGGVVAALLVSVAAALAIVAAAQPRWGTHEAFVPRSGAQVVFVLDVSRSMASTDVAPSRLAAAKTAITTTLKRLGGDRVGLVIFAGNARLRFPLTTDFSAAAQVVESLETGAVLVEGGTDAASGLDVALEAFDPASDSGRLIVLITDGDDLGTDPAGVAGRVQSAGIELLVGGDGTARGGSVPVFDGVNRRTADKLDARGNPIVTRLNEPFLQALAAAAGGRYLGSDMATVPGAVEGRLASLKRARVDQQAADLSVERFQWFAAAALAALLLATAADRVPRLRRPRRSAIALGGAALAVMLLGACATRAYDLNEEALSAFAAGDTARAVDLFTEAQAEKPDDASISLNLAAVLASGGRYDDANLAARRALNARDAGMRARAFASIGHHRFSLGDLDGSLDAFHNALLENPADANSRHDYEVVFRLLHPKPPDVPGEDGATSTPGPGGATPSPAPGGASPAPGADGTPAPGSQGGQQDPQGPRSPGGQSARRPGSPEEVDRQLAQLDQQINRLVQQAGDNPTATEALAILQLLAERARVAAVRDALAGPGNPNDY
jgi:Ca-activated chloride channel family protein